MGKSEADKIMAAALDIFPQIVKRKKLAAREKKKLLKAFSSVAKEIIKKNTKADNLKKKSEGAKAHPWRECPIGEHWVKTHMRAVPKGETEVEGNCRINGGLKDELHKDELDRIAQKYFSKLKRMPNKFTNEFKGRGEKFDTLIAGWTQYWNEIFNEKTPLDPDLVKALIASESSFHAATVTPVTKGNLARGLTQITDRTRKILGDARGELKNHLIELNENEIIEPNANIAAATRWLFHKKQLANRHLGREANWDEAIIEYKGYMPQYRKNPKVALRGMRNIREQYANLKK